MKTKLILFCLFISATLTNINAQSSKHWTIYGDKYKFIDGEFKPSQESLFTNVYSLSKDADGSVYVSTAGNQFFKFNDNKYEPFIVGEKPKSLSKIVFNKAKNETWICESFRLQRIKADGSIDIFHALPAKRGSKTEIKTDENHPFKLMNFSDITVDDAGTVYITGAEPFSSTRGITNKEYTGIEFYNGVKSFDGVEWKQHDLPNHIENMIGTDKGFVAILAKYELLYFDGATYHTYQLDKEESIYDDNPLTQNEAAKEYEVTDIFKGSEGKIWVTGIHKIFLFEDGKLNEQFSIKKDTGKKSQRDDLTIKETDGNAMKLLKNVAAATDANQNKERYPRTINQFAINKNGICFIDLNNKSSIAYNIQTKEVEYTFKHSNSMVKHYGLGTTPVRDIAVNNDGKFIIPISRYYKSFNDNLDDEDGVEFGLDRPSSGGGLIIFEYPNINNVGKGFRLVNRLTTNDDSYKEYVGQANLSDDLGNMYMLAKGGKTFTKFSPDGKSKIFSIEALVKEAGFQYPETSIYTKSWCIGKKTGTLYFVTPARKYTFKLTPEGKVEAINITMDKKLAGKTVKHLAIDEANNALWLMGRKGIMYKPLEGGTPKYYTKKETGVSTGFSFFGMKADRKGNLWVSYDDGLAQFTKDEVKIHTNKKGRLYLSKSIIEDNNQKIYSIGTNAIYVKEGDDFKEFASFDPIAEAMRSKTTNTVTHTHSISQTLFDKSNNLWAIVNNKFCKFDGSKWEIFNAENFYANKISTLFKDKEGRVNIVLTSEREKFAPMATTTKETTSTSTTRTISVTTQTLRPATQENITKDKVSASLNMDVQLLVIEPEKAN